MGKRRDEQESYVRYVGFDTMIEYDASGRVLYFGACFPGKETSDALWSIYKQSYDASGRPTLKRYADATDEFVHKWTDRATLTYLGI